MKIFLAILFLILGVLFVFLGVKFYYAMWRFKANSIKAIATVVEIKTSIGRNNRVTYSPVLSFKTNEGKQIIYDVNAYYFKTYGLGRQIEVLYLKQQPDKVRINTFKYTYASSITLIVLGLFCIGMSIGLYLKQYHNFNN